MQIHKAFVISIFGFLAGGCAFAEQPTTQPAAAPAGNCTLIVHVTGVRNTKGWIGAALYKTTDGWPEQREKAFSRGTFPIVNGASTAKLENLPPGDYGLVVLHDENMNHKLDRNFLTIPKEGFGFANNPRVALTAPKMKDAMVKVACPTTESNIKLIYK